MLNRIRILRLHELNADHASRSGDLPTEPPVQRVSKESSLHRSPHHHDFNARLITYLLDALAKKKKKAGEDPRFAEAESVNCC